MLSLNKTTLLAAAGAIAVTALAVAVKVRNEVCKAKPVVEDALSKTPLGNGGLNPADRLWPSTTTVVDTTKPAETAVAEPVVEEPVTAEVPSEPVSDSEAILPENSPAVEGETPAKPVRKRAPRKTAVPAVEGETPAKPVRKRAPRKTTAPAVEPATELSAAVETDSTPSTQEENQNHDN